MTQITKTGVVQQGGFSGTCGQETCLPLTFILKSTKSVLMFSPRTARGTHDHDNIQGEDLRGRRWIQSNLPTLKVFLFKSVATHSSAHTQGRNETLQYSDERAHTAFIVEVDCSSYALTWTTCGLIWPCSCCQHFRTRGDAVR